MNDYRINNHYAKALLLLSIDMDVVDRVADDMRLVSAVCAENRELAVVFANPVVPLDRKLAIVNDLFASRVTDATLAFLLFVTRKKRSINLRGIADAYITMFRDYRGIVFSEYTGKTVELHDRTDPKMLGCFKLEFDNKMYDARIRTKIRRLRNQFARNDYESKL